MGDPISVPTQDMLIGLNSGNRGGISANRKKEKRYYNYLSSFKEKFLTWNLLPVLENSNAEKKVEDRNGELEKKENATSESKNAKKKKKDKSSKEQKESQNLPDSVADGKTTTETAGTGKAEDAPVTDVKERHKKVASVKKKKSRRWMLLLVRLLLGVQGLPWQREKIRRLTTISSLCGKQADKWQSTCIFSLCILLFCPLYFQSFHYHIWAYALCSSANAK
ncbi:hypothetical protein HN51_044223 [Arachis hypogaea]